jgi:short-subunit dehydrogenase
MALTRKHTRSGFAGQHVLICGASGNLGGHIARQLAPHGLRLTLWGRNAAALEALAAACRMTAGTRVTTQQVDIADIEAALAALRAADDAAAVDAAFFIAGAGSTREPGRRIDSPELVARLGMVNYVGPTALAAELGERMAIRASGRIILVSSAAAAHPLPFAAAYASSKSGLSRFAGSLRLALKPHGVSVTLASPGFFAATASPAHAYPRPGEVPPDQVAARLIAAAARGRAEVVTPGWFVALGWLGIILPRHLYDRLLNALPAP